MGSESNTTTHTGACACGAVRYEVCGPFSPVIACHCETCRRTSGHFPVVTSAQAGNWTLVEDRGLRWYRSSGLLERGFCGDCGASLFWKFDAGDRLIFALGSLDDTDGFGVALHMFVEEKGGYYDLEGDTMKMTGGEYRQRLEMGPGRRPNSHDTPTGDKGRISARVTLMRWLAFASRMSASDQLQTISIL